MKYAFGMNQEKHRKFQRLATLRGERVLKDLRLVGNLSNRNNYEYTDAEVKLLFAAIEEELKLARYSFESKKSRGIKFK